MTSPPPTVPNMLGAATPDVGLFPPGGAYFGYTTVISTSTGFATWQGSNQFWVLQCANTFYVYWVNGTTPPFYLLMHKQTGTFSPGPPSSNSGVASKGRGWMMTGAQIGASVQDSNSSDVVTLGRTSPDTGATIASVSESMMLNVPGSQGSLAANRPFTAVDEASLNLTDWTVLNQATLLSNSSFGTSVGTQWFFCETTPWNPTAESTPQPDTFYDGNNNNYIFPFSPISQSSLSVTTYATWTITNPAWTSTSPVQLSVSVQVLLGMWLGGILPQGQPANIVLTPVQAPQPAPITLQLDQIATKVPSGTGSLRLRRRKGRAR